MKRLLLSIALLIAIFAIGNIIMHFTANETIQAVPNDTINEIDSIMENITPQTVQNL
ncbi:MAG: hypothetical protein IKL35_00245 [Muribaculaceae bacterium]|nr:hypothetical protein [Muribaculaceae bacterium]